MELKQAGVNSDTRTNPTKNRPGEDTDEDKLRDNHSTSVAKDFQTRLHATLFFPRACTADPNACATSFWV